MVGAHDCKVRSQGFSLSRMCRAHVHDSLAWVGLGIERHGLREARRQPGQNDTSQRVKATAASCMQYFAQTQAWSWLPLRSWLPRNRWGARLSMMARLNHSRRQPWLRRAGLRRQRPLSVWVQGRPACQPWLNWVAPLAGTIRRRQGVPGSDGGAGRWRRRRSMAVHWSAWRRRARPSRQPRNAA